MPVDAEISSGGLVGGLDARRALIGGGIVVALLLVVVVVLLTRSGGGGGKDTSAAGSSATLPTVLLPGPPGSFDPQLDTMSVTESLGVIHADMPITWNTDPSTGELPLGGPMPTLVSAVDPGAFLDANKSVTTPGVRITFDPTAHAQPSDAAKMLDGFIASSESASGTPITESCSGTAEPSAIEVGGYRGVVSIIKGCGSDVSSIEVAVLVSEDDGSVVTFEGHAPDLPGLIPLTVVLRSITITPT